jgi:hypothetical protein
MAWVFVAELSSGNGKGLARVAAMQDIHQAAPRSAVEGSNVVPDRSAIQGRIFHPRHERGRSVGFPFDVSHSPISWDGNMDSEVEAASSCAEGNSGHASPCRACLIASGGKKSQTIQTKTPFCCNPSCNL